MATEEITSIITQNKNDIAFIIGNGINRHKSSTENSWSKLLSEIWESLSSESLREIPRGISFTEFFDLLDAKRSNNYEDKTLNQTVAEIMQKWNPREHHTKIISKIKELDVPVLTTNFDEILSKAAESKLFQINNSFTDYYPWGSYHSSTKLVNPTSGFALWYINGMIKYNRSIRLGLTQYMASVGHARKMIYSNNENCSGLESDDWPGSKTWLDIFFKKSLFIFGLALEENETFLRWLLIERFKYFEKHPASKKECWYLCKSENTETYKGKKFFLEHFGIKVIEVTNYDIIYDHIWDF